MKAKLFFIVTILLLSCSSQDDFTLAEGDSFIFGHFFGECAGEFCVETFKLTSDTLFEDTIDRYLNLENFNFVPLSIEQYDTAKSLTTKIPQQLLRRTSQTFGCPDCADQGGIIVLVNKSSLKKQYIIDLDKSAAPKYLHEFIDQVTYTINRLNEDFSKAELH
ncbi:MAG: hypothetical protein AAGB24_12105 [Bacteroidota bacterium]